jgi:hypothetical protein
MWLLHRRLCDVVDAEANRIGRRLQIGHHKPDERYATNDDSGGERHPFAM